MRIRFGLREKIVLITLGAILLSVGFNTYFNMRDFVRSYKESVEKRVFVEPAKLKSMLEDITELGLALGELRGVDKECREIVEAIPYAKFCFVASNEGEVYYHSTPEKAGFVQFDPVMRNAIEAREDIIQTYRSESGELIYDFSTPIRDMAGEQLGVIRVGVLSEIIDREVSRIVDRALWSGIFFIAIACTGVSVLSKVSILNPLRELLTGVDRYRKGDLAYRVRVTSTDELGEFADSFNRMAGALEISRDRLQAATDYTNSIIASMIEPLIVVGPDARIKTVNRATLDLLGYEEEELLGKDGNLIFAKEEASVFKGARFRKLIEEGVIRDYDMEYRTKGGEVIPVSFCGSVIKDGGVSGIVGVARDMREIKKLVEKEKELAVATAAAEAERKKADELERAYEKLAQSKAQLTRALKNLKKSEAELRESQRKLFTLMSNLPGMAYRCANDRDWTMEFVSEGCLDMTGHRPEDLIGNRKLSYAQLIHEDDKEDVWNDIQSALEKKTPFRLTYRIKTADGAEKWVWEQGLGIFSPAGDLVALEGFIADVTERRKAEEDLRESERKFRAIFDQTFQFTGLLKPDGTLLEANRTALDFVRAEESEVLGKPFWETPWWAHSAELQKKLRDAIKAVAEGEFVRFETTLSAPDGSLIWADFSLKPVKDEEGNVVLLIPEGRDITVRKKAEDALRDSENKYRTLFESSRDGIVILRSDGRWVGGNPAAVKMFGGKSEEDLINKSPDVVSPEYQPDGTLSFEKAGQMVAIAMEKGSHYFEWQARRLDGTEFPSTVLLTRMELKGKPYLLCTQRDITQQKKAEKALRETTAQLIQNEKMIALGELSAGVAHELNQPLNIVKIICQDVLRDIEKDRFSQETLVADLKETVDQVKRMASIIDHMRIFTRRSVGEPESVDVNEAVEGILKLLGRQLRVHDIEMGKELTPDLPRVLIDPIRLEQVLMNLINNARDALEKSGREEMKIEISSYFEEVEGEKEVTVTVKDNAGGVPKNIRERIFEPFFTTKRPGRGTGLGLSVSSKIITDVDGRIDLEVEEGMGSTFKVVLPVKKEGADNGEGADNRG